MKKIIILTVIALLVLIYPCISDNYSAGSYMGSKPLGIDFTSSTATEGPIGGVLVSTPGVGSKAGKSISTGFSYVNINSDLKLYQIPFSFTYTPIDKLDLSLSIPYIKLTDIAGGVGDIYTSLKTNRKVIDDLQSAVQFSLAVPTGAKRYSVEAGNSGTNDRKNNIDLGLDFIWQREFEQFVINGNMGITMVDMGADNHDEIIKSGIAFSRSFTKNLGGSIDFLYQTGDSFSSLIAGLGCKYNLDAANSLTFAIGRDLHKSGVDFLLSAGYSRSF